MSDAGPDTAATVSPPQPGREGERPTTMRYRVLLSACLLAVVTYLLRVGFSAVSSEMRSDLGLGQDHLGYLMAAFMVAYGLFEVPWGWIGDRFGVRNPLVWVALGGSITTGAVALVGFLPRTLAWSLGALLLLRGLFGMFQAGTFPLISRMMTDWMPTTERGSAQGFIWMASRLGGSLAPLLLKPLFQWLGNWKAPLVIAAGVGVVWVLGFWPFYRDRPEDSERVNQAERDLIASGRARKAASHHETPWGRMLRSRSVWALCIMYGGIGYAGNFFLFFLPDYLKTQRQLTPGQVTVLSSLPFVFGLVACLAGGAASDLIIRRTGNRRWSRRLVGLVGLSLAAVSFLATIWAQEVVTLGALLCLTFFCNDLSMGPAWAAAADKGEEFAGTLGGLMNMTASMTGALAMIVTGQLLHHHFERLPFVLFAVAYGIGALAWFWVDVTHTLGGGAPQDSTELVDL